MQTRQQAGIVCCSDGLTENQGEVVQKLRETLYQMNISVIMSPYLYQGIGTAKQKAQALMELYDNDDIHDVFDISGASEIANLSDYILTATRDNDRDNETTILLLKNRITGLIKKHLQLKFSPDRKLFYTYSKL